MPVPDYVRGCIAPCYTVWKEDQTFDEQGQRNLLDFMLQSGAVTSYFVRSGMGQMFAYEYEDVKAVTKTACDHLKGKAPVLMNCSGIWTGDYASPERPDPETYTNQAIELSQYALEVGADAIVQVVPEALVPPHADADAESIFERFYERVCEAVDGPVVIYHPQVPHAFSPALLTRLADIPNMVGIKVSTWDGYFIFDLIRAVKDKDFMFVQGAEMLYYAALYAGSRAVIGAGCNLNPQILKAELERFEAGDHAGVLDAQESVNLLVATCPPSAQVMKRMATESGFPVNSTGRRRGKNVYKHAEQPLDEAAYQNFLKLREQELAKYV
jgi:4-hydroxy-tetrahydrodipicolinate synthase